MRIVPAPGFLSLTRRRELLHIIYLKKLQDYLQEGDCLVINDTKVIPARLIGAKEGTGAKIEILLLKRKENNIWETLVKPGKKAKVGTRIVFGEGLLVGEVVGYRRRRKSSGEV